MISFYSKSLYLLEWANWVVKASLFSISFFAYIPVFLAHISRENNTFLLRCLRQYI